jgi:hypothetical protein
MLMQPRCAWHSTTPGAGGRITVPLAWKLPRSTDPGLDWTTAGLDNAGAPGRRQQQGNVTRTMTATQGSPVYLHEP